MRWYWLNDKEPDEDGNITLVIENAKGARTSTFKGKDEDVLIAKMADSYVNATQKLAGLMKPDSSGKETLRVEPKHLSSADRLRLSADITDPERVVEAVEEIVSARMGVTPERVGNKLATMDKEDRDKYLVEEASNFRLATPDYYPVPQNSDALYEYISANRWDVTRNNLALAFQLLYDEGKMIPWPSDEEREQERNFIASQVAPPPNRNPQGGNGAATAVMEPPPATAAPAPTPNARPRATSYSTGLRNADASATRPTPTPKAPRYTRADIERMSRTEFADKLRNEPGFKAFVDSMT